MLRLKLLEVAHSGGLPVEVGNVVGLESNHLRKSVNLDTEERNKLLLGSDKSKVAWILLQSFAEDTKVLNCGLSLTE